MSAANNVNTTSLIEAFTTETVSSGMGNQYLLEKIFLILSVLWLLRYKFPVHWRREPGIIIEMHRACHLQMHWSHNQIYPIQPLQYLSGKQYFLLQVLVRTTISLN